MTACGQHQTLAAAKLFAELNPVENNLAVLRGSILSRSHLGQTRPSKRVETPGMNSCECRFASLRLRNVHGQNLSMNTRTGISPP